jgi:hypothetical protein
MNHLSEEQLLLHYYGEEGETLASEQHLEACGECRALYGSLLRVLNMVDALPVPDRGPEYGSLVWSRIGLRLPARRRFAWLMPAPMRWAATGAALAGLVVAAFFAGRFYPGVNQPGVNQPGVKQSGAGSVRLAANADPQHPERILLVAVGDYLERSQMVLIELANTRAKGPLDISSEQERAGDLVAETRLYRQTAAHTGDANIASVLDELERVLLDITHAPSKISPQELESLRQRLKAEGILFKIRVLGTNVRNQDVPAAQTAGQTL